MKASYSFSWSNTVDKNPWVVEKEEKRICFGVPGYLKEWKQMSSHETKEEAQKKMKEWEKMYEKEGTFRIRERNFWEYKTFNFGWE